MRWLGIFSEGWVLSEMVDKLEMFTIYDNYRMIAGIITCDGEAKRTVDLFWRKTLNQHWRCSASWQWLHLKHPLPQKRWLKHLPRPVPRQRARPRFPPCPQTWWSQRLIDLLWQQRWWILSDLRVHPLQSISLPQFPKTSDRLPQTRSQYCPRRP